MLSRHLSDPRQQHNVNRWLGRLDSPLTLTTCRQKRSWCREFFRYSSHLVNLDARPSHSYSRMTPVELSTFLESKFPQEQPRTPQEAPHSPWKFEDTTEPLSMGLDSSGSKFISVGHHEIFPTDQIFLISLSQFDNAFSASNKKV